MISRRLRISLGGAVGAAALAAISLGPALANAAETAPAWDVAQVTSPTIVVPGTEGTGGTPSAKPRLDVFVTNVGDAVAGTATITDTLPAGVTVASAGKPEVDMPNGRADIAEPCAVSGQTVTCAVTRPTASGELVEVLIPLAVGSATAGEVVNDVSVSGGGAPQASSSGAVTVGSALPSFGFSPATGLRAQAFDASGLAPAFAGSHPFMIEVGSEFNTAGPGVARPVQGLRNLRFDLPGGIVVNPAAVPVRCTAAELAATEEFIDPNAGCPVASQVGVVYVEVAEGGRGPDPLYLMVPPPGHPAELAFSFDGVIATVLGGLGGDFHLTAESSELLTHFPIVGVDTFLWGVPSDPGHDPLRYGQGCNSHFGCPSEATSLAPFLTMPSSCTEPMELRGTVESWLGGAETRTQPMTDVNGEPIHLSGCDSLAFEPTIESKATTGTAESPSGLDFAIHQPQDETLEGRATATLKNATVALPEGMTLNAAAANGLSSCTEEQMGYQPEEGKIRFNTSPQTCPAAAKIGMIEVRTPVLETVQPGNVYVAKPFENPFGSLLAIYLAVEDKETGIVAKLAGKVTADPATGRLTATFTENPELPLEDIDLHFFGGAQGALTTPLTCGQSTTTSTLTPWSTPEGADAHPADSFQITSGCFGSEAAAPKSVAFTAGTVQPLAGTYSPFVLRISRPDGSQHITGIDTTLPEGLLGSIAGVSYCPESGIAQARSREEPEKGTLEQGDPSCPASSELGSVKVTAGSGENPVPISGRVYLAGPYKGAPLSLAVIVPAVAGPYDLGTVVDRVALFINEQTARLHAVADPLPTIREGIPLDVRSIELNLDRARFMLNPTSCETMAVEGQLSTQASQSTPLSDRFQVGGCQSLPFKPAVTVSTQAKTSRANGASLTVKISQKAGEANIHKVSLQVPRSLPTRLTTLQKACTEAQFNLNPAGCPEGSYVATAVVHTPLLATPLTGPGILVSHGGAAFPDLEFVLQANERGAPIRITLDGKTQITKGITYSRFETVPDTPITSFETTLPEGPHSILDANGDLCDQALTIPTTIVGQNGAQLTQATKVATTGCSKPTVKVIKANISHGAVALTFTSSRTGTIAFTSPGLKSAKRSYSAGRHTIRLALNAKGNAARSRHSKIKIKLALKTVTGTATQTSSLHV